jgi:hypothetical protein
MFSFQMLGNTWMYWQASCSWNDVLIALNEDGRWVAPLSLNLHALEAMTKADSECGVANPPMYGSKLPYNLAPKKSVDG